ncbi:hypothetical protein G3N92_13310 [Burkholderia sp. Ac-20379]|uniref:hypothetical protein n=1 Tax=Burkholderia sp. Ac-20379 TaxID=2703900 RepID=UPI0019814EC6|nr:hypothetical protein [Burkholderia sp. Ac-20379]MBN3725161.1 hypothetical protein [Burkholderia sp. Ac-20379]
MDEYVQRATRFMAKARGWCEARGLSVQDEPATMKAYGLPDFAVPGLVILAGDVRMAQLRSAAWSTMPGNGAIDLSGPVARHSFYFHAEEVRLSWRSRFVNGELIRIPGSVSAGVGGNDWFWTPPHLRRHQRVDESLFIDLLRDMTACEL